MKSKLLFTAALMSAASLASQETYEAKGIVTDKSAYEYAMGRLLADAEDGQVDVSGWVMRNAKMSILSAGMYDAQMGWNTDVTGGNFRIRASGAPRLQCVDVDRSYTNTFPRYVATDSCALHKHQIIGRDSAGEIIDVLTLDPIPADE